MPGGRPEVFNFTRNPSMPKTPGQPLRTFSSSVGGRKKAVGVRSWLVLNSSGQSQLREEGKYAIMRRTGLPARDLRILDPLLSYPSTVLGRERAIVINLEHIKAIITAQEVLLISSNDPLVLSFVEELQRRILCHHRATKPQEEHDSEGEHHTSIDSAEGEAEKPQSSGNQESEAQMDAKQRLENYDGSKILPFEFIALEACLDAASSSFEHETSRLELEAYPALDKLSSKISTLNLDRVRQIKSRLVAITGRVQKVRDELEHLLDDDEDMAEMYLTEKLAQKLDNSSDTSIYESDSIETDLPERDEEDSALSRNSRGTDTSSTRSTKKNIEELEMLLEAYFVQIDATLNKIATLREYVDDTEDYINITLDDKQNQLLQMGVMLTTATLVMSVFIGVTAALSINIKIELFKNKEAGPTRLFWTCFGGLLGSLFLYGCAIGWYKRKRLLE